MCSIVHSAVQKMTRSGNCKSVLGFLYESTLFFIAIGLKESGVGYKGDFAFML